MATKAKAKATKAKATKAEPAAAAAAPPAGGFPPPTATAVRMEVLAGLFQAAGVSAAALAARLAGHRRGCRCRGCAYPEFRPSLAGLSQAADVFTAHVGSFDTQVGRPPAAGDLPAHLRHLARRLEDAAAAG